ncbi:sensor histidine kinase [Luteimonas abyssi]|uniref:sensor histidine kinase n=1 Tax=Luteimonas abyssi TaxID=1247514 RepID=UPI000737B811
MPASVVYTDRVLRRELHLLALYRLLEASLVALLAFSPFGPLIGELHNEHLARAVALAALPAGLVLLWWARRPEADLGELALIGVTADIVIAMLVTHAMPAAGPGVALLLLTNIGGAALFLRLRVALLVAGVAAAATVGEYAWSLFEGDGTRPLAEIVMFGVSFLAVAVLTNLLGERMRESHALAERRSEEAAGLAGLNELILRRMRTGVLIVDADDRVQLANEAAGAVLGEGPTSIEGALLPALAPELATRLATWRLDDRNDDTPLHCGPDRIETQPRFTRLLPGRDSVLVFLDDASVVARRAESLTLSTMGRFSASLAHEIRNPLAAINYATQLLEEAELSDGDRRLLQIIHQQCQRTNGIVESVLGLARRERARPERIALQAFVRHFIEDFQLTLAPENGSLRQTGDAPPMEALFDPRHLHQILTVLAHNAIHHGRLPGEAARVAIAVELRDGRPAIEVSDRGPGIPDATAAQIGRPFFTTSEHGTGLGLYIAQELARANSAALDYVPVPGGGACFRLGMAGRNPLLPA